MPGEFKSRFLVLASLFVLMGSGIAYSQDKVSETSSLKGIAAIGVVVDDVDRDAVNDGLNKPEIATAVIQQLKRGGVKVVTGNELASVPGQPRLVVYINTIKHSGGVYSFTVSLSLDQMMILQRDASMSMIAPSWSLLGTGASLPEDLNGDINEYTKLLVDQFIKDYNSANKR